MMAKSHVVVGAAAWIVAAPLLHASPLDPAMLGLAVAGSLLPDIDHPKSWVGRRVRPLSTGIARLVGHRGITHSMIAVAALILLAQHAGYHRAAISAVAIGYLSHLCADMLTPAGVPLAWPSRATWSLPVCRTGSMTEPVIVLALVGLIGWWLLGHRMR